MYSISRNAGEPLSNFTTSLAVGDENTLKLETFRISGATIVGVPGHGLYHIVSAHPVSGTIELNYPLKGPFSGTVYLTAHTYVDHLTVRGGAVGGFLSENGVEDFTVEKRTDLAYLWAKSPVEAIAL